MGVRSNFLHKLFPNLNIFETAFLVNIRSCKIHNCFWLWGFFEREKGGCRKRVTNFGVMVYTHKLIDCIMVLVELRNVCLNVDPKFSLLVSCIFCVRSRIQFIALSQPICSHPLSHTPPIKRVKMRKTYLVDYLFHFPF